MFKKIEELSEEFFQSLNRVKNERDLEELRVLYLGKKGIVTSLLRNIGKMQDEEKRTAGREINELKKNISIALGERKKRLVDEQMQRELDSMPEFDMSMPPMMQEGSYHPITLVQRQCENVFRSMGFTVEDYSEVVTDYECFGSLNISEFHPARDMQDTYYLENGQLLKTQTSAAQNAIYRKYGPSLMETGKPIMSVFPGRCFRNESTDACHENTFFQMEGVMVDHNVSVSNLIFFMKSMLSEVFQHDIHVRLRPGFFPFVEPGFELDINCLLCGGSGCSSCKHSGWLELCPCGMIHPNVLVEGGIDPEKYAGFAFGLGMTRLAMMKYGIADLRDLNSGSLMRLSQFTGGIGN